MKGTAAWTNYFSGWAAVALRPLQKKMLGSQPGHTYRGEGHRWVRAYSGHRNPI